MTTVVQTQGLCKSFGEVDALKPVDLTVTKHAIFGFLGPNGAGKTTLMKLLLGLIQPSGGSAAIFGKDKCSILPPDFSSAGHNRPLTSGSMKCSIWLV